MIRILLTGFGKWEDLTYNPTSVIARALDGAVISGSSRGSALEGHVDGRVLDVAWSSGAALDGSQVEGAARALAREVAILKPHILLSLGVDPKVAYGYDVEAMASDRSSEKGIDVRGKKPKTPRLHTRWPEMLDTPFPAKQIIDALNKEKLHAEWDFGLGYFLCERIAYEGARLARLKGTSLQRAGFIHVCNPLVRAELGYAGDIHAATAEQKKLFEEGEAEVIRATRIALEVCLASLPADAETRPRPWRYEKDWMPEMAPLDWRG